MARRRKENFIVEVRLEAGECENCGTTVFEDEEFLMSGGKIQYCEHCVDVVKERREKVH